MFRTSVGTDFDLLGQTWIGTWKPAAELVFEKEAVNHQNIKIEHVNICPNHIIGDIRRFRKVNISFYRRFQDADIATMFFGFPICNCH